MLTYGPAGKWQVCSPVAPAARRRCAAAVDRRITTHARSAYLSCPVALRVLGSGKSDDTHFVVTVCPADSVRFCASSKLF
eukprot:scaffold172026_cov37-Prasinocladus_malaysianus.AAC.1